MWLGFGALHLFEQTLWISLNDTASGQHNSLTAPKILIQRNAFNRLIPLLELYNVAHFTAAPLVNSLIVIPYDTKICAKGAQLPNEVLLKRIDVLVFIHNEVLN